VEPAFKRRRIVHSSLPAHARRSWPLHHRFTLIHFAGGGALVKTRGHHVRHTLSTLALSLVVSSPAVAEDPPTTRSRELPLLTVPHTQFQLPNGLRVVLHEDHSVPLVSVNVWFHVGSAREKPGRTGFAHLFEHLMFEGSQHVKEGQFDSLLESSGGDSNGSTNTDRTNYYITVPSNALELALFLESDRMGFLLPTMTPAVVDGQRDVVKNERRQRYENQPYGMASIVLDEMLFPEKHPYRWPTIGHMEDLTAASYEDVVGFHRMYYGPNNATLVVAGDIDPMVARPLIEKWFSDVQPGTFVEPLPAPVAYLTEVKRRTIEDGVQLPRLYLGWLTPPLLAPGDAELDVAASVLAGGKNSRLYKRLVYELQVAQDVSAYQSSASLASTFFIVVTARPGQQLDDLKRMIDEELERLRQKEPEAREVQRVLNGIEASFYGRMEQVGGKADALNAYFMNTGNPDYFAEDLARYQALTASDVQAAIRSYLPADRRVELSVVPQPAPPGPSASTGEK
jgi:zinc protease